MVRCRACGLGRNNEPRPPNKWYPVTRRLPLRHWSVRDVAWFVPFCWPNPPAHGHRVGAEEAGPGSGWDGFELPLIPLLVLGIGLAVVSPLWRQILWDCWRLLRFTVGCGATFLRVLSTFVCQLEPVPDSDGGDPTDAGVSSMEGMGGDGGSATRLGSKRLRTGGQGLEGPAKRQPGRERASGLSNVAWQVDAIHPLEDFEDAAEEGGATAGRPPAPGTSLTGLPRTGLMVWPGGENGRCGLPPGWEKSGGVVLGLFGTDGIHATHYACLRAPGVAALPPMTAVPGKGWGALMTQVPLRREFAGVSCVFKPPLVPVTTMMPVHAVFRGPRGEPFWLLHNGRTRAGPSYSEWAKAAYYAAESYGGQTRVQDTEAAQQAEQRAEAATRLAVRIGAAQRRAETAALQTEPIAELAYCLPDE